MDEDARQLHDALRGLESGPILDGQAVRLLAAMAPQAAASALGALLALDGPAPEVRRVLSSLCRALLPDSPLPPAVRAAIHRAAAGDHHPAVVSLFSQAAAVLPPNGGELRAVRPPGSETLGHRTQRARVERSRDKLLRLCADDDPSVVRNLLLNPRLTEAQVVRIAARRPVPLTVLEEVARSKRWNGRGAVRRALVSSPFTAPATATALLHELPSSELRAIAVDPVLHPAVREAAQALLLARSQPARAR